MQLLGYLDEFRKLPQFVYSSYQAPVALSEILSALQTTNTADRVELVRIKVPNLILDIDVKGLANKDKLTAILNKQKTSFFSAGAMMRPQVFISATRNDGQRQINNV